MKTVMLLLVVALMVTWSNAGKVPEKWYTATNTTVSVDLNKVTPRGIKPLYLSESSCLSYYGPIGSFGPLSRLGPIGDNSWNPSAWMVGGWSEWAASQLNGPMSAAGPLGHNGPMTQQALFHVMPSLSDFAHHMLPAGLFSVLGPLGPLGALGPLGPLGVVGAHGFARDSATGHYLDSQGHVVRKVAVPFEETPYSPKRSFELFEWYTADFARTAAAGGFIQDTSFMVEATVDTTHPTRNLFPFMSQSDQVVTVVLSPCYTLDVFSLTLLDSTGNVVASTTSSGKQYVPWIQLNVAANEKLFALVTLDRSLQPLPSDYRLFVVGSTTEFANTVDITGPHIHPRM